MALDGNSFVVRSRVLPSSRANDDAEPSDTAALLASVHAAFPAGAELGGLTVAEVTVPPHEDESFVVRSRIRAHDGAEPSDAAALLASVQAAFPAGAELGGLAVAEVAVPPHEGVVPGRAPGRGIKAKRASVRYRVVMTTQSRAGPGMQTEKVAVVKKGQDVEAFDAVVLESGVRRVRIGPDQWISERSAKGDLILVDRQHAVLQELNDSSYTRMVVRNKLLGASSGGSGGDMTVRVRIRGWSKKSDEPTPVECADMLEELVESSAELHVVSPSSVERQGLRVGHSVLVSRRQQLNEAALLLQALCRGRARSRAALQEMETVRKQRKAAAARLAAEQAAAAEAAAEAARVAEEEARLAAEKEREAARRAEEAATNAKEIERFVAQATAAMARKDFLSAVEAYTAALAVPSDDTQLRQTLLADVDRANAALLDASCLVQARLEEGNQAAEQRDWDTAIRLFSLGLAVEGNANEQLQSSLQSALEDARSCVRARDSARADAEAKRAAGNQLLAARDYASAIEVLYSALELDTQSPELNALLDETLTAAEAGKAAQEAARAEAESHASVAASALTAKDFAQAIRSYDAARACDVNDVALTESYAAGLAAARASLAGAVSAARGKLSAGEQVAGLQDWAAAIEMFSAGLSIEGADDKALRSALSSRLEDARVAKRRRDQEVREAEREAATLWAVVHDSKATIESIEAALARSPVRYGAVLRSVREARDALERSVALRRTDVRLWRTRLLAACDSSTAAVTRASPGLGIADDQTEYRPDQSPRGEQSGRQKLIEAEAILQEFVQAAAETQSRLRHERLQLESHRDRLVAAQLNRLRQLLAASPVSVHVDTAAIHAIVSELEDVQHGEVWGAVLELQLRAEAIDEHKRELELLRLRLVKHTGTAPLDQVEELLHTVSQTPAEWRQAMAHEVSRLRAYYTRASQEVSESLLQMIEQQRCESLPLVEETLEVCRGRGYGHPLIQTARAQLEEHHEHLMALKKAVTLQAERHREATKRAAAEARYNATRGETEELESQVETLQRRLGIQRQHRRQGRSTGEAVEQCILCHRSFAPSDFEAHAAQCALEARQRMNKRNHGCAPPDLVDHTGPCMPPPSPERHSEATNGSVAGTLIGHGDRGSAAGRRLSSGKRRARWRRSVELAAASDRESSDACSDVTTIEQQRAMHYWTSTS